MHEKRHFLSYRKPRHDPKSRDHMPTTSLWGVAAKWPTRAPKTKLILCPRDPQGYSRISLSLPGRILVLEYVGNFGVRLPPGCSRHGVSVHCMCVHILGVLGVCSLLPSSWQRLLSRRRDNDGRRQVFPASSRHRWVPWSGIVLTALGSSYITSTALGPSDIASTALGLSDIASTALGHSYGAGTLRHCTDGAGFLRHCIDGAGFLRHRIDSAGFLRHCIDGAGFLRHRIDSAGFLRHRIELCWRRWVPPASYWRRRWVPPASCWRRRWVPPASCWRRWVPPASCWRRWVPPASCWRRWVPLASLCSPYIDSAVCSLRSVIRRCRAPPYRCWQIDVTAGSRQGLTPHPSPTVYKLLPYPLPPKADGAERALRDSNTALVGKRLGNKQMDTGTNLTDGHDTYIELYCYCCWNVWGCLCSFYAFLLTS